MKRARLTAEHFAETSVIAIPAGIDTEALERAAIKWVNSGDVISPPERRDPANARLRGLMDQKRALDNAIHAERLRLRH